MTFDSEEEIPSRLSLNLFSYQEFVQASLQSSLTFIPTGNSAEFPVKWEIEITEGFPDEIKVREDHWRVQ